MFENLKPFLLTFIPIAVAVDAIGNIPLFISLVDGLNKKQRRKIIMDSVYTATVTAILFVFIGKFILNLIGITIVDFQIAGGALLFIIALRLLLPGRGKGLAHENQGKDVGVFPLGTPLITGPAVLTTTLMMRDAYGLFPTFISLILNMILVWFTLVKADFFMKLLGQNGIRAFSKIMFILLSAIGVMMMRKAIMGLIIQ